MGIKGVLEAEIDIKSSGDLFHEIYKTNPHDVSKIAPDKVHACDLHEGEYGQPGSVICWHYTIDGKRYEAKEIVEAVDEENKSVRFKVIEGDVLRDYKSLTISVHVIPKGEFSGVKWVFEYEKMHDDGPYPTKELNVLLAVAKDIEAHHLKDA